MNLKWMLRQILTLATANLKTRYRQSFAGFIWVVLNPLILFGAQAYVFSVILKISAENYILLFFCGLLPWIFFSSTIDSGATLLQNIGRFIKGMPVHPLVFIIAHILDGLVNFVLSLIVVGVFLFLIIRPDFSIIGTLYFSLALIPWILFTAATTFLIGILQVTFRDTRFVLSFAIQVLFYLTPIIYPATYVPENLRWTLQLNPLYHLLHPLQSVSQPNTIFLDWTGQFVLAMGLALMMILFTWIFWKLKRDRFYAQL